MIGAIVTLIFNMVLAIVKFIGRLAMKYFCHRAHSAGGGGPYLCPALA